MQDADLDRRRLCAAAGENAALTPPVVRNRGGGGAKSAEAAAGKHGVGWCHEPVPYPFCFVAGLPPRITIAERCNRHATNP